MITCIVVKLFFNKTVNVDDNICFLLTFAICYIIVGKYY
nr:MAG TPA: hypothetical protein [Caudoviricetes sp.]